MKIQKFSGHCLTAAKLMKQLALLTKRLEADCSKTSPRYPAGPHIQQNLLVAFGLIEAIRHTFMSVEAEDTIAAYVMSLALTNLVNRLETVATQTIHIRAQRPKTLPKYTRALAFAN